MPEEIKVISIGNWKLQHASKHWTRPLAECDHKHVELDSHGDIVRCVKCKTQVSAFWALSMLAECYDKEFGKLQAGRSSLEKAKESGLHLLAARKVEKVWRSRTDAPACPHCGRGILAKDDLGSRRVSIAIEMRRREVGAADRD